MKKDIQLRKKLLSGSLGYFVLYVVPDTWAFVCKEFTQINNTTRAVILVNFVFMINELNGLETQMKIIFFKIPNLL